MFSHSEGKMFSIADRHDGGKLGGLLFTVKLIVGVSLRGADGLISQSGLKR